jgi:hypothetical protein
MYWVIGFLATLFLTTIRNRKKNNEKSEITEMSLKSIIRRFRVERRLIRECEGIAESGTGIRSFTYHGKRRNVLIGASKCQPEKHSWGELVVHRSVLFYRGNLYLVAVDNNDARMVKRWKFSDIEDFGFKVA